MRSASVKPGTPGNLTPGLASSNGCVTAPMRFADAMARGKLLPPAFGENDLSRFLAKIWSGCRDLNSGPLAPQATNINHLQRPPNETKRLPPT